MLKLKPHASFERSGNDLLTKVQITISEALLGFKRILLTHLDGRGIEVSRENKVTRPGDTIILRGEGMPHYKNQDTKGDLYLVFDVEFPDDTWAAEVDKKVRFISSYSILIRMWLISIILSTEIVFITQLSICSLLDVRHWSHCCRRGSLILNLVHRW